jgi:NAD(P)-dependent dehydrogenase (short-subunit alcohol dehydrogenase family)
VGALWLIVSRNAGADLDAAHSESFSEEELARFGGKAPMGHPGQPEEIAPSYVFLACNDSSYMSGQVLHPNGGEVING